MGARLLFRDSQGRDGAVELTPESPVYVGRGLDCAIRSDDAMVSRRHSMIRLEQDHYFVEDMGSSNGTHVNDVQVQKQHLAHNDVVRCGSLWLRYVEDGPIVPQPASTVSPMPLSASGSLGEAPAMPSPPAKPMPEISHASELPLQRPVVPELRGEAGSSVAHGDVMGMEGELGKVVTERDELQNKFDREAADGKRHRAEAATLRDRIEELGKTIQERDDMIGVHGRVADALRGELDEVRVTLADREAQLGEVQEGSAAHERQMQRAKDDIGRVREELSDRDRELSDLARTKDEGWQRLNDQLAEIEHLREVINQQERLLEERRVGLINLEQALKELREAKEDMIAEAARIRAERDEYSADLGRQKAQVEAIDHENKRLSKLLGETAGGGDTVQLAEELKDARVMARKLETENERIEGISAKAASDNDDLKTRVAELEVELRDALDDAEMAQRTKEFAEDALVKAEESRRQAGEDKLELEKARDVAGADADEARRELERLSRQAAQDVLAQAGELATRITELEAKLAEAEVARGELELELETLKQGRRAEAPPAATARYPALDDDALLEALEAGADEEITADGSGPSAAVLAAAAGAAEAAAVRERALEVYEAINDTLSDFRGNLMLLQGEFGDLKAHLPTEKADSAVVIGDAVEMLVGGMEEAKGVLRTLKELAEVEE